MASSNISMSDADVTRIGRQMEAEVKRLTRHRLKDECESADVAITRLARAGVLTKRFATLVKRILKSIRAARPARHRVIADAPDALAVLRIVPNSRS